MDSDNNPNPQNQNPTHKKKNRTLQFYKFLLNSIKIEISINEFLLLVKYSNEGEIVIWIISLFVFYAGDKEYPLVWLHIIHVIRGILGILIINKLPRSYELMEKIDSNPAVLENRIYNDAMRDAFKEHIMPRIKDMKGYLLSYFALTFVNFMIDVVDFLYIISNLNSYDAKASTFVFFLIALVYIVIDLSYVFWSNSLKYIYSRDLLNPIHEAFSGVIQKIKTRLKLNKKKEAEKPAEGGALPEQNHNQVQQPIEFNNQNQVNHNQVELDFKQPSGNANKGYDSIQIDFEGNQAANKNNAEVPKNQFKNKSFQVNNRPGFNFDQ